MLLAAVWRWRGSQKLAALTSLFALALFLYNQYGIRPSNPSRITIPSPVPNGDHPIDDLIERAQRDFEEVLRKETFNVLDAAEAYRQRRGRHPPPGFDAWFRYAKSEKAVIIEDLFDQIYHDLEPFWALPPKQIRDSVIGQKYVISVRKGRLDKMRDKRYRINFWHEMFKKIAKYLPDVDVPFNIMDESRLLVPWETIDGYMSVAVTQGRIDAATSTAVPSVRQFTSYEPLEHKDERDYHWITQGSMWDLARTTCPPDSPGRDYKVSVDFSKPPQFPKSWPYGSYHGYVGNWTVAKNPCLHPELSSTHGSFIEPLSISISRELIPLFGGSKLPMNNEILVPAPRYWTTESRFSGSNFWSFFGTINDWSSKSNALIWRGVASGGRNRIDTWTHYQRHRFLSMLNATHVEEASRGQFVPQNFPLPDSRRPYQIKAVEHDALPAWIESIADAAFTDLECFPKVSGTRCEYTDKYYDVVDEIHMYKMLDYKYLPDIDGNSFSGRYRAFLMGSSVPIKATVYNEWHDSRIFAWQHFVPMDNNFVDFYGIMDYFLGYEGRDGNDAAARRIAEQGKSWSDKVLRKEDMLVYIYRLVLEYARVSSDDRDVMGYA